MALTYLQLMDIRNGEVHPNDSDERLIDIIRMAATIAATDFVTSHKLIPTEGDNSEASAYLDKMFSVCRQITNGDSKTFSRGQDVILSILYSEAPNIGAVTNKTTEQWFVYIKGFMIQAFEIMGSVRINEANAYEQLS